MNGVADLTQTWRVRGQAGSSGAAINPATDALRNITGILNANGTVTIYGVTSTVSTNGDPGADPNKLVSITDTLANTTAAGAAAGSGTVALQLTASGIAANPVQIAIQ